MPKAMEVPITPSVLDWAIAESGFSDEELAQQIGVTPSTLAAWKDGAGRPSLTELRKVASKLHRQLLTFLLPAPPQSSAVKVEFRDIASRAKRQLNPVELRYLRRARRMQQVLSWLETELDERLPALPRYSITDPPESAAAQVRQLLKIRDTQHESWVSASKAFDHWRASAERLGIAIFLFPLGAKSCRGFSLWHEPTPVIAINTAWSEEARIYTLLHEFGHLVTRSNSACAEWAGKATRPVDPIERWCERFAAAVLLPRESILRFLGDRRLREPFRDLAAARAVANRFRVSLRASTLRLIELHLADWDLYEEIPPAADSKPTGGGGGGGRDRLAIREDEIGTRGASLFVEGVRADVLSRSQAVDYLDIPDRSFDDLSTKADR